MKKKKIALTGLQIKSFVTKLPKNKNNTILGGTSGTIETLWETCEPTCTRTTGDEITKQTACACN